MDLVLLCPVHYWILEVKLKIYIAAPWVRKEDAKKYAATVERMGYAVTSRWFHHDGNPGDSSGSTAPKERIIKQAHEDIEDIHNSHGLIVLNLERSEGKAVETGIALEIGIPIASVGPRGNIFLALCEECETIEEAVEYLENYWKEVDLGETHSGGL